VCNADPQTPQKRLPGVVEAPHEAQSADSGLPHSSQYALPSSVCDPQAGQTGMSAA